MFCACCHNMVEIQNRNGHLMRPQIFSLTITIILVKICDALIVRSVFTPTHTVFKSFVFVIGHFKAEKKTPKNTFFGSSILNVRICCFSKWMKSLLVLDCWLDKRNSLKTALWELVLSEEMARGVRWLMSEGGRLVEGGLHFSRSQLHPSGA